MRVERVVVYVPDADVRSARQKGLTNLSRFVREKLIEFNNAGAPVTKPSTPATATNGGE